MSNIHVQEHEVVKFVPTGSNQMTEAEYQRQRAELQELYGDSSAEAAAKRDQALAVLFYSSGWTQEQLAAKEGISTSRAGQRLCFGQFLNFSTHGGKNELLPKTLSEKRFRGLWDQTDRAGNDRQRFREVQRLIAEQTNIKQPHIKLGIGPEIMDKFADGKWHQEDAIAKQVGGDFQQVKRTLYLMQMKGTYNSKCETKKVGTKISYRIFRQEKMVGSHELAEKLGPLIEGLKVEGKKNMATVSISAVARLAALLQQQLDAWTK